MAWLAGVYTGATAEATVAVGLGANALIGGSNRHGRAAAFVGERARPGLNLAAGVASLLELRLVRQTERTDITACTF